MFAMNAPSKIGIKKEQRHGCCYGLTGNMMMHVWFETAQGMFFQSGALVTNVRFILEYSMAQQDSTVPCHRHAASLQPTQLYDSSAVPQAAAARPQPGSGFQSSKVVEAF
jgi:hypothetical protein